MRHSRRRPHLLHRQMAAVVARLADLRGWPEQRPRLADIAVALAEVHAVGAEPLGQAHAVVDDERDIRIGANALQRLSEPRQLMLVHVLHPQLECRGEARLKRRLQPVGKAAANILRADQVKPRRLGPLRGREVERIELVFVQGQAGTRAVDAW